MNEKTSICLSNVRHDVGSEERQSEIGLTSKSSSISGGFYSSEDILSKVNSARENLSRRSSNL